MWVAVAALCVQTVTSGRLNRGRFTIEYDARDARLAAALADVAVRTDTFPGLSRPHAHVVIALAPDNATFRAWAGRAVPDWGAAVAFPQDDCVVMHGGNAGSNAGDPRTVLRHELAHLALHEYLGNGIPRWFDEGYATYAAREWQREDILAANVALAIRGVPSFDELDRDLSAGAGRAEEAYALAHRAVSDLAAIDPGVGLSRLIANWHLSGSLDLAMRATYGMTLDGFQQDWQRGIARRYGGLALLSNLAAVSILMAALLLPLFLARRRRNRARYQALVLADEVAERSSRSEAPLPLVDDPPAPTSPPGTQSEPGGPSHHM